MKTEYRAFMYRHEARITRLSDVGHIRARINDALYSFNVQEPELLGTFASEADAIACANQPCIAPQLKDAWAGGKLLLWESTVVVPFTISVDDEECGEETTVQHLSVDELAAYVMGVEDEEE